MGLTSVRVRSAL